MAIINTQSRPLGSLTTLFALWKTFLLTITLGASLAPDYDTSTSLFFHRVYGAQTAANASLLAQKLTRWDALYFIHASRVGKIYEQEWAFGTGLSGLVSGVLNVLPIPEIVSGGVPEPLAAIAIATASHLFSVLALYKLTLLVSKDTRLSFVAACLHIISPAGLFLSAPYAESTFSCLSFLGFWVFALSQQRKGNSANGSSASLYQSSGFVVLSGVLFGLATVFRSNGLACGLLFAVDAIRSLLSFGKGPSLATLVSLVAPLIGGLLIVAGYAAPQVLAWSRYCAEGVAGDLPPRPWCTKTIPSIYSFVQEHYWDVGFLRYWTLNQLPLFLLASPVLALFLTSGIQILRDPSSSLKRLLPGADEQTRTFVRTLAAAQAFVALLAITTYHVQVINRLASGYVIWYWWIASCILDEQGRRGLGSSVAMFFVMYAGVQGGLFSSFLPPA